MDYIKKLLYLYDLIYLFKQLLDYLNIIQIVNKIIKLRFQNLNFLLSKTNPNFKTIIFIKKICQKIAYL